jgi:PilZ domain-containing protein
MAAPFPTSWSDGRSARRITQILAAELSCPDEHVPKEMTFTDNVSIGGARVITVRRWLPGARVLVTFLRNGIRSEGRVAYCHRNLGGDFTIGVDLSSQGQNTKTQGGNQYDLKNKHTHQ